MLKSIRDKGGKIKPTHLMYKANLSHNLMKQYLEDLIRKGLVQELTEGKSRYLVLTEKGFDFLMKYRKMKEFTDAFGL